MSAEGYMTKNDLIYFTDNFNEYQKNGIISFDLFSSICREFKGIIDKAVLEESLNHLVADLYMLKWYLIKQLLMGIQKPSKCFI